MTAASRKPRISLPRGHPGQNSRARTAGNRAAGNRAAGNRAAGNRAAWNRIAGGQEQPGKESSERISWTGHPEDSPDSTLWDRKEPTH